MSARCWVWDEPERCEKLRRLWDEGHTTRVIAEKMHCSRNSVIEAAHRMGLAPRPYPIKRLDDGEAPKPRKPRKRKVMQTVPAADPPPAPAAAPPASNPPVAVAPEPDIGRTAPLAPQRYVERGECAWPEKTTKSGRYVFCCAAVEAGKPYCTRHCDIAYARRRALRLPDACGVTA